MNQAQHTPMMQKGVSAVKINEGRPDPYCDLHPESGRKNHPAGHFRRGCSGTVETIGQMLPSESSRGIAAKKSGPPSRFHVTLSGFRQSLEQDVLRTMPENEFAEGLHILPALFHRKKMITRKLSHLAGKTGTPIYK